MKQIIESTRDGVDIIWYIYIYIFWRHLKTLKHMGWIVFVHSCLIIFCSVRWYMVRVVNLTWSSVNNSVWPLHIVHTSQGCGRWRLWLWQVRFLDCQAAQQTGSEPVCTGSHHHRCPQWSPAQAYWTGENKLLQIPLTKWCCHCF